MTTNFARLKNKFQQGFKNTQQQAQQTKQHSKNSKKNQQQTGQADLDGENEVIDGIDSRERKLIKVLQFSLLLVLGYFILGNVRPYVDIVNQLFFQWQNTGVFAAIARIPLIGWFISGGIDFTKLAIGTGLWLSLQLLELLPSFMMDSPSFILGTLNFIASWVNIPLAAGDSPIARKLKQRYNTIPSEGIEQANVARGIAYLIDGAICLWFFQPIVGGWGNLSLVLTAGSWDYIDWKNVIYIISTLFAVEVVYGAYKMVTRIATIYFANND
jgi:hypothetical protein